MKIIDNRKKPNVKEFRGIKNGECFIDGDGDINIKIVNLDINETSAVCLRDGQQWFPHAYDTYEMVTTTLTLE